MSRSTWLLREKTPRFGSLNIQHTAYISRTKTKLCLAFGPFAPIDDQCSLANRQLSRSYAKFYVNKRRFGRKVRGMHHSSGRGVSMKRFFVISCTFLMVVATGLFAMQPDGLAVGGEGSLRIEGERRLPAGGMLLLHVPGLPLMLAFGAGSAPAIAVIADYWIAQGPDAGVLSWYVGFGGYLRYYLEPNTLAVGARLPLALQLWPFGQRNLEFFIEIAPAVGIRLIPTGFDWHLQGAAGLRYWVR